MIVPSNLTAITDEIIELELIPDYSNLPSDPSEHKFSWKVIEFGEKNMEIKVSFE